MGTRLTQVAFDIETTGFETGARVTVVGFALPLGDRVFLNTGGRPVDAERLESRLSGAFDAEVRVSCHESEAVLLSALSTFVGESVAPRDYLLVAYNGELFNGGFDLPFLRSRYARQDVPWPFEGVPYADVLPLVRNRFNTVADGDEQNDLVTAYDTLVGGEFTDLDPFAESSEAVAAYEAGEFASLLAHNIADVRRTAALGALAERYCGKAEFDVKSLTPTVRDPDLGSPG